MYYVCTQSIVTNLPDVTKSHITHLTSHITCHTQHKVFRCKEEPRRVNQSAFQISTLPRLWQSSWVKCLNVLRYSSTILTLLRSFKVQAISVGARPQSIITIIINKYKYFTENIFKKRTKQMSLIQRCERRSRGSLLQNVVFTSDKLLS